MGAIQGTINSIIGTTGRAVALGSNIAATSQQDLSTEALKLKDAEYKAQDKVKAAQDDVALYQEIFDKNAFKPLTTDYVRGTMTHDIEKSKVALELAQRNLSAIQMQRANIEQRMKRFGGKQ